MDGLQERNQQDVLRIAKKRKRTSENEKSGRADYVLDWTPIELACYRHHWVARIVRQRTRITPSTNSKS